MYGTVGDEGHQEGASQWTFRTVSLTEPTERRSRRSLRGGVASVEALPTRALGSRSAGIRSGRRRRGASTGVGDC